jgi:hypothetical protein
MMGLGGKRDTLGKEIFPGCFFSMKPFNVREGTELVRRVLDQGPIQIGSYFGNGGRNINFLARGAGFTICYFP